MIYLNLFWTFFKIGLFTIGGGYAMIPLIDAEVVSRGWLTEETLMDFIAISESTPGPFAVNVATFIGSGKAGFWGAVCTTVGVVLPSFVIIFIIAKFLPKIIKKPLIKDAFSGLRPAVIGLITFALVSLGAQVIFPLYRAKNSFDVDFYAILIFEILLIIALIPFEHRGRKRNVHPILLLLIGAGLGILAYGVL